MGDDEKAADADIEELEKAAMGKANDKAKVNKDICKRPAGCATPAGLKAKPASAEGHPKVKLGCPKCRGSPKGCIQCRNPAYSGCRYQR